MIKSQCNDDNNCIEIQNKRKCPPRCPKGTRCNNKKNECENKNLPKITIDNNVLIEEIPDKKIKCSKKKVGSRKTADYNAFELVFALGLCGSIHTKEDIINYSFEDASKKIEGCSEDIYKLYINDVKNRTSNIIESWLKNLNEGISKIINTDEIEKIYLEGKNIKSTIIKELNKGIDKKQAKADVFVKLKSGTFIGFSIKQDGKCTISNYSIEKFFRELSYNEINNELINARNKILKEACIDNSKKHRTTRNALYKNSLDCPNDYWKVIYKYLKIKNSEIKSKLAGNILPTKLPYDLYEFEGIKFSKLNISVDDNITFEKYEPYYFKMDGELIDTCKVFYKLIINDKKYRVEIRLKETGSAQFCTFHQKETPEKALCASKNHKTAKKRSPSTSSTVKKRSPSTSSTVKKRSPSTSSTVKKRSPIPRQNKSPKSISPRQNKSPKSISPRQKT